MAGALERTDPEVFAAIARETERQRYNLELIASENIVTEAVLEAQGSVLTNKYAEGLPGKRYYGGCEFVDQVEQLAIDRACALFGAEGANVQPHSGAQANMCVYFAELDPGDTILAMNLSHSGHLKHGSPVNFSGLFRAVHAKTINASVFPGNQGGPLMHVIAAKAVALKEAASPEFAAYQRQVVANARALGDGLVRRGFRLASGGTDNHLLLVDLRGTEISGKVAQETLDQARITVNKNAVPFDPRPPFVTSGVRIGTPAVTTRGMREPEMDVIADLIRRGLEHVGDARALAALGAEVRDFCARFPIYPGRGG